MDSSQPHPSNATPFETPFMVIEPPKGWFQVNWHEVWQFRELLYFLTWRDVKVKYKQALLGFAWAVIVPITNMLIFGTIFGQVAELPTGGVDPYIFYLVGLVPWQYFATAVNMASQAMVSQQDLLTKIYLPRLFLPAAACIANLLDYGLAFVVMIVLMLCMQVVPAATTLLVIPIMLVAILTALGVGLFFAALNVKYRDIKFVIPFLVQIWMYVSILLSYSQLPESWGAWRYLYGLNPMAVVIEASRWAMLSHIMTETPPLILFVTGIPSAVFLFLFGLFYFKRMEKMFADVV
ncbi:MAG: ABC transporter permease [bacterium]|jgi:lipopolysaccharide transport system permease protein|nr:ABC transporter permease [bacterium]